MRSWVSALGAAIAVLAALHKMLYASVLVNDDFMHRAYALQLLAGEWPIRDFFDYGMVLMYVTSALAQMVFGYRLLAEAMVIGIVVAASTFLVFDLVRRLTTSTAIATLSAVLFVVAMPRSYGYPKLIVYAVAAVLWWQYVAKPTSWRAVALGVWTAIAFYWRPDHGVYMAIGVTLAMIAAHGVSVRTMTECVRAGVVTIALVVPWLVFASVQMHGISRYVESGMTAAVEEHITQQTMPRWPIRRLSDLVMVDPPEQYAPSIGLRWTRDSSPESRQQVIDRYGLTVVATRDDVSQTARVSERTIDAVRALVAEPIIEDTDGIDRGAAQISESTWPPSQRRRFDHWWLRLHILPTLGQPGEGGELATIFLFALPLAAIALAAPLRQYLPTAVTTSQLISFAVFTLIVDVGVLRAPFNVRVGDGIVLPGIVMGILVAVAVRATRESRTGVKWAARGAAAIVVLLLMKSLAGAGQSTERVDWVAGEWESWDRSRAAREEVVGRLMSSPPIDYWQKRNPEVTIRLAAYARECVPESERILVLWFAPEIYYYSDRLMATRHAFFLTEFGGLPFEREMEIDKIKRLPPAIVFTRPKSERSVRKAFPEVMHLVGRDYHIAGSIPDNDDPYQILVRADRTPVRDYGADRWPCYR
jgi:hypothetical protein